MKTADLRPCDACSAPITAVVYAISVQQYVADNNSETMSPVGKPLDLQMCIRCGCGLNTHALPLAIEHRAQQVDRAQRDGLIHGTEAPPGFPLMPDPPPPRRPAQQTIVPDPESRN